MENIISLYPQYNNDSDRRKKNVSVENDRRIGIDRRLVSRSILDPKLKNDLNRIKNVFLA